MRFRPCDVTVTQLPQTLTLKHGRAFFKELEVRMNIDRPCVVLDCSNVREMDRSAIHMLLCCLEEAMKRDGDVKLVALRPDALAALKLTHVDRLFEIYDTETEAVNSFFRPHSDRGYNALPSLNSEGVTENAA